MKIDLHCHTQATKNEGEKRNISVEEMIPLLVQKEVRIVSITNHNLFDIEEYNKAKELGEKEGIQFYPGVEVDVIGFEDEHAHVIIVVEPEQAKELSKLYGKGVIQSVKSYSIKIDALIDLVENLEYLLIVHYGKKPELSEKSLHYVIERVEKYRLFYEPTNFRSLSIHSNKGHSCLIGSDIKDWSKYLDEENILPELKLEVKSFHELVLLAKRDKDIVNTLLNRTRTIKLDVSLKREGSKEVFRKESVVQYDDLNVIFGGKGSGKSKYLEFIRSSLKELGVSPTYYNSDDAKDVIDEYKKVEEDEFIVTSVSDVISNNTFENIREWKETKPTSISLYIDAITTNQNKRNRKYISIVERTALSNEYSSSLNQNKEIFEKIDNFTIWFSSIDESILPDDEHQKNRFTELLDYFRNSTFEQYKSTWIGDRAIRLSNSAIETIKKETDILSNGKSIPSKAGLEDLFVNYIKPYNEVKQFINFSSCKPNEKKEFFGDLEEGKKLFIKSTYSPLNRSVKSNRYSLKSKNIKDLKRSQRFLEEVYNAFGSSNYKSKLVGLVDEINVSGLEDLSEFVCISRRFCTDEEDYYKPSSGEEKVIAFQKVLEEDSHYYLLDEPEKSLGNFYTSSVILPHIKRLSRLGKCVVCTTHSANIAVLGMPYQTIYKDYSNREYQTYSGNMYINELVCLADNNKKYSWSSKSLELLEGGEYAFNERSYAYGIK